MQSDGMLLVVAAAPFEFSGFSDLARCGIPGIRWSATAPVGAVSATLVANGAGGRAAVAGTLAALAAGRYRAVVSTGFAGGLDPALRVGDAFLADSVLCAGQTYRTHLPKGLPPRTRRGSLVTVDEVAGTVRSKRRLARLGADAVDMEAGSVAAVAADQGLPFYCVRAISDHARQDLPLDFNRAIRPDGAFSAWNLVGQAAVRVGSWPDLFRLWRGSALAARTVARCLCNCEFRF